MSERKPVDWNAVARQMSANVLGYDCPGCAANYDTTRIAAMFCPMMDMREHPMDVYEAGPAQHANFCVYRPTKCRVVNCGWKGNPMILTPHVNVFHGLHIKHVELNQKYAQRYIFNFSNSPSSFEDWIIYRCDEQFFWKYTYLDSDKKMLTVRLYHLLYFKEPNFSYYGVQTFKATANPNFRYSHSMLADTKDIKDEELTKLSSYCMVVPFEELAQFSKAENNLNYTFQILKRLK